MRKKYLLKKYMVFCVQDKVTNGKKISKKKNMIDHYELEISFYFMIAV